MAHAYLLARDRVMVVQRCNKVPWPSRKIALQILRSHRKDAGVTEIGEGKLVVYRCRYCDGWHTGHDRSRLP